MRGITRQPKTITLGRHTWSGRTLAEAKAKQAADLERLFSQQSLEPRVVLGPDLDNTMICFLNHDGTWSYGCISSERGIAGSQRYLRALTGGHATADDCERHARRHLAQRLLDPRREPLAGYSYIDASDTVGRSEYLSYAAWQVVMARCVDRGMSDEAARSEADRHDGQIVGVLRRLRRDACGTCDGGVRLVSSVLRSAVHVLELRACTVCGYYATDAEVREQFDPREACDRLNVAANRRAEELLRELAEQGSAPAALRMLCDVLLGVGSVLRLTAIDLQSNRGQRALPGGGAYPDIAFTLTWFEPAAQRAICVDARAFWRNEHGPTGSDVHLRHLLREAIEILHDAGLRDSPALPVLSAFIGAAADTPGFTFRDVASPDQLEEK